MAGQRAGSATVPISVRRPPANAFRPGRGRGAAPLLATLLAAALALCAAARAEEAAAPAAAAPPAPVPPSVCAMIEAAASGQRLPRGFFTRLIWRESSFRANVVSPKGAQGIAQFMPGTAAERGLADPFDPVHAIPAAAELLRALADQFGNLGLAAAAYNAGPDRVSRWIAGSTVLPAETESYVYALTGSPAADWKVGPNQTPPEIEGAEAGCEEVVAKLRRSAPAVLSASIETAPPAPWGVQVAGNFSRDKAIRSYQELQRRLPGLLGGRPPLIRQVVMRSLGTHPLFQVRVPAPSRAAADSLCRQLTAAGSPCVVFRN
jgi:hypothetical protein